MSVVREDFIQKLNSITSSRAKYATVIRKIAGELLKRDDEKRTYDDLVGQLLTDYMKDISAEILKYYGEGDKAKRMPPTVKDFLAFMEEEIDIQTKAPQTKDEDFIPCKEPIKESKIRFDDIAGQEEVKKDIEINYIFPFKLPLLFTAKSQGILMYGMPGTGKTLLAKAATAEIPDVAFYTPTPGELRGKYEGETERLITRIFECARETVDNPLSKYKFAIIFIDEFEGVAGNRKEGESMVRSVNALLQAMDGITSSPNVSVIAATNFPDKIDSAIRRRFTAEIFVDLPTPDAREFLIRQVLAKNYSLPGVPMEERTKDLFPKGARDDTGRITEWRNDYLGNIEEFGDDMCWREFISTEEFSVGRERVLKTITSPFIKEIVEMTGPKRSGVQTIEDIIKGEDVDPNKFGDQGSVFGYSASDVVKMMNIAVQIASFRAMENAFVETRFEGDKKPYYRALPLFNGQPDYVEYVAMESVFEKHGGDINNPDDIPNFKLMTPEQKFRAVNFGICQEDVREAIERYPSTIKNNEYIDLLKYKYRT